MHSGFTMKLSTVVDPVYKFGAKNLLSLFLGKNFLEKVIFTSGFSFTYSMVTRDNCSELSLISVFDPRI